MIKANFKVPTIIFLISSIIVLVIASFTLRFNRSNEVAGGDQGSFSPFFISGGRGIVPKTATWDFGIGATSTASSEFAVDPGNNTITLNGIVYTWPAADGILNQRLTTNGTGGLSWATVSSGGGGGTAIGVSNDGGATFTNVTSLSFEASHFNATFPDAALIKLDWGSGGPASLSQAETISANWVNTANPWADNEVVDTITASNYLLLSGGTLTGPLIGTSATLSVNFETMGYASASFFKGSAFPASNCNSTGQVMRWATTGLFTCGTLSTSDIDYSAVFQGLDSDLTALANNSTNGLWARTGSGTGSARTLTGTTNQVTVTNGDGVSGNPTFTIPSVFIAPGTASVTTNFEAIGFASASAFRGSGLPDADCSNTTSSKVIWNFTTGRFSCATDQTGGGGGGTQIELKDVPGTYNSNVSSVSFDGGKFTVTASGSAGLVNLDWGSGGPASLSEAETISGNWVNTTNPWADNEVADILTLNGGTIGNNTLSSGATFTGSASISANFEVVGYASASQYFGGFASHTFQGTIVGKTTNTLSVGTIANKLKNLVADVVRAISKLVIPIGTPTLDETGAIGGKTASASAGAFLRVDDGVADRVVSTYKCYYFQVKDPTAAFSRPLKAYFNDPFTISEIAVVASKSGGGATSAVGWNLGHGLASTSLTNVFTLPKAASHSSVTRYTSFADSTIADGEMLYGKVTSASSAVNGFNVDICGYQDP